MKIVRTTPLLVLLLLSLAGEAGCHSVDSEDLGISVEVAGLNVFSVRLSPRETKRSEPCVDLEMGEKTGTSFLRWPWGAW